MGAHNSAEYAPLFGSVDELLITLSPGLTPARRAVRRRLWSMRLEMRLEMQVKMQVEMRVKMQEQCTGGAERVRWRWREDAKGEVVAGGWRGHGGAPHERSGSGAGRASAGLGSDLPMLSAACALHLRRISTRELDERRGV